MFTGRATEYCVISFKIWLEFTDTRPNRYISNKAYAVCKWNRCYGQKYCYTTKWCCPICLERWNYMDYKKSCRSQSFPCDLTKHCFLIINYSYLSKLTFKPVRLVFKHKQICQPEKLHTPKPLGTCFLLNFFVSICNKSKTF